MLYSESHGISSRWGQRIRRLCPHMVALQPMSFRQFPGLVMATVLCSVGMIQMVLAWSGWTLGLGWQWGLVAIILSLVARFNGYILVGTFFFCAGISALAVAAVPGAHGGGADFPDAAGDLRA
mgnify:CR=1 FL=1